MDDGYGGSFSELKGYTTDSLSLTYTKSTGIYAGLEYRVRYRAKNAIGWSDYSDITYILAARKPDTPSAPKIAISGSNAVITFSLPFNGGTEITKATI